MELVSLKAEEAMEEYQNLKGLYQGMVVENILSYQN